MLNERQSALWNALGLGPQYVQRNELRKCIEEAKCNVVKPIVQEAVKPSIPMAPKATKEFVYPRTSQVSSSSFAPIPPTPVKPISESSSLTAPNVKNLDWDALKLAVESCHACPLCNTRNNTVFSDGRAPAELLLIGEAPGQEEDLQGVPFVGRSGKLLTRILESLEFKRGENLTIINTIKCRPPQNRNPKETESLACRGYLERQIELIDPKLIVLLGRPASESLFGAPQKISALRGRVHQLEVAGKIRHIIVSYHPSYLLRSPEEKRKAWIDWCLVADTFDELKAK